ncbi:DUF500-domain-containing protein [Linderina pennispora]|uniref:DUF500-domain-containing protein n=1 Tax=Linderina pennispora TaxID=61395 RepID=A0A1Y1WLB6_9FUNG|nr:DUF500-domain-containing protein [Linderina pennispora]ORX74359.1 DUF500-domain-containing protein [Linderina pennispora]
MGAAQVQENFNDVGKNFTLAKECERAARILTEFVVPPKFGELDDIIPTDVLQRCHGIAVLSVIKAGFIWSGRVGSGLVCARLPDGTWSGPSAIGTAGAGIGGQIGAQLTEVVMILNNEDACQGLGSNISVSAGPLGRSGEIAAAVNTSNVAAVYSYSKSKGLFAGVSIEGSAVMQRKDVNEAFYGRAAPPEQVLAGRIPPPEDVSEWEVLRTVLNERCTPPHAGQAAAANYGSETLYDSRAHADHEDDLPTSATPGLEEVPPATAAAEPRKSGSPN